MTVYLVPDSEIKQFLNGNILPYSPIFEPAVESGILVRQQTLSGDHTFLHENARNNLSSIITDISIDNIILALNGARDSEGYESLVTIYENEQRYLSRFQDVLSYSNNRNLIDLVIEAWDKTSLLYNGRCWPIEFGVVLVRELGDPNYGFLSLQRKALGSYDIGFGWDKLYWFINGDLEALTNSEIKSICDTLQSDVSSLKINSPLLEIIKSLRTRMATQLRRKKKSNPIPWLIGTALIKEGVKVSGFPNSSCSTQCPFASAANLGVTSGITRWHFLLGDSKDSILHVLSSYSSTHKHKEYSAKARLAFYAKGTTQIKDIAFILDGHWREAEVNMFIQAGLNVFQIDDPDKWIDWAKSQ